MKCYKNVAALFTTATRRHVALRQCATIVQNRSVSPSVLEYPFELVDDTKSLTSAIDRLSTSDSVAIDVEAFCLPVEDTSKQLGEISLVQACSKTVPTVFLFDALVLKDDFVKAFRQIAENDKICKLFYDCRRDVEALQIQKSIAIANVLDMQLYFTAIQWKLRSANRRSGLSYALKNLAGVERKESDSAVQSAMTVGNRPVWDVRPLPYHFLEYAASDVRYIQLLYERVTAADFPYADKLDVAAVKRVSQCYVEHYGTGTTVQQELDDKPVEVNPLILERYLGPGGVCRFCGGKGHTEAECFKKQKRNTVVCSFCGQKGHIEANCFKKHPEHNKCSLCGQVGHKASNCFKASPCKHCGGFHRSENCIHTHKKQSPASGKT